MNFVRRRARALRLRVRGAVEICMLRLRNTHSRSGITGVANVVVSLTTHGARVASTYLAIESIGRGTIKPGRVILWLDEPQLLAELDRRLARLVSRGLEVRVAENYGPHTKYFPFVNMLEGGQAPLATADDDVIYPRWWLSRLLAKAEEIPEAIHAYRAHKIGVDEHGIAPYSEWEAATDEPDVRNFGTGVFGVLYPTNMQVALRTRGDAFMRCTPKADDVWLHYVALLEGIPVRQMARHAAHFPTVRQSQVVNLRDGNNDGGNDMQIAATYSTAEVARLARAGRGQ